MKSDRSGSVLTEGPKNAPSSTFVCTSESGVRLIMV